jgi:hypothetical protein
LPAECLKQLMAQGANNRAMTRHPEGDNARALAKIKSQLRR